MGASANLSRPDRPWLGTAWALAVLVFLVVLFVSLLLGALVMGGPDDWTPTLVFTGFAAIAGFGILLQLRQMQKLARRWNTPLFDPTVWTLGSGAFLGLVLWTVVSQQWWARHVDECLGGTCTSRTEIELVPSVVTAAVVTSVTFPFLLSLRRLIATWLSLRPAR